MLDAVAVGMSSLIRRSSAGFLAAEPAGAISSPVTIVSKVHRLLASGIPMKIGFACPIDHVEQIVDI